jgi:hypothetical protein
MGPVFAAFSFSAYLFASIYVIGDKKKVEQFIKSKIFNVRKNKSSLIKIPLILNGHSKFQDPNMNVDLKACIEN